jgi:hypothetical protein
MSDPRTLGSSEDAVPLGRIAIKQMRVSRAEAEPKASANPMNRLVPYLDLFVRLGDDELARLSGVDAYVVAQLREQVVRIGLALERYVDLLPRLGDDEMMRLTGVSLKTLRFWRLCQPRTPLPLRAHEHIVTDPAIAQPATPAAPFAAAPAPAPAPAEDDRGQQVDPGESQHAASRFMNFAGEPFPGFEDWDPSGGVAAQPAPGLEYGDEDDLLESR